MGLFSLFGISSFAQINDETVYEDCRACTLSPDSLSRYISFMRSLLGALESTKKIDIAKLEWNDVQWRANTLVNDQKSTLDEYLGVFKKEGRYVGGELQWATRETIKGISRDFFTNFGRETIAGVKSEALVRDLEKLEELDESIDREATTHITHFQWKEKLSVDQVAKMNQVFSTYSDIFQKAGSWVNSDATYKDMVTWMGHTNRIMKDHVTLQPNQDVSINSYRWITYSLKKQRSDKLQEEYSCVRSVVWLNCNPTYGKTSWLWNEFKKSAGKDLKTTFNKFKHSWEKLSILYNKKDRKEYFWSYFKDYGDDWWTSLNVNGRNINSNFFDSLASEQKWLQSQKDSYAELLKSCKETEWTISEWALFRANRIICREPLPYEMPAINNITKQEEAKMTSLLNALNKHIELISTLDDDQTIYVNLASPLAVTHKAPLLSRAVYETKQTVHDLLGYSIESCLAFCSNLNGKVNCGSQ